MKSKNLPSLALAALLQIAPICRVATSPAIAPASFAIIARCAVAVAALLGTVDAVSGASAAVYVAGVQSLLPSVPGVTTSITRPVGSPIVLRIILGGGVGQQPQLDYYNATPLPPGLNINTNINMTSQGLESTNYFIYGTPTTAGVWSPIVVTAGNILYEGGLAMTNITITITNTSGTGTSPPSITSQPQSTTTTNGGTTGFSVVATGEPAPSYQWWFNGAPLMGATQSSLIISNAQPADAGQYSVAVSNSVDSIMSSPALLSVLYPPVLERARLEGGKLTFDVAGPSNANIIILSSPDLKVWTPLRTNAAPGGRWMFQDASAPAGSARFYRGVAQP